MFSLHTFFGIAAPIASLLGLIPYIRSIIRKETKPSGPSWWTWSVLAFVAVASSWAGGANWQVLLLPVWLCLLQLFIAILSIKYGDNNWDFQNKLFIGIALLSIVVWFATGNPLIALAFTIIADLFASFPNFRHVAKNPEQEHRLAWGLGWLSGVFALLAIKHWNFASFGWAVYFFLNMSIVMFFLLKPRKNQPNSKDK